MAFLDGPAAGVSLLFGRAPAYLRVVRDRTTGAWDVLDQVDDEPDESEDVFVYRRLGEPGYACVRSEKGRGHYAIAEWVQVDVDVEALGLRDNDHWRAWASACGPLH